MKPAFLPASALSVAFFAAGCASIVNYRTTPGITVKTATPGARVLVDGEEVGKTPITVRPEGIGKHVVRVEADGRKPVETELYKSWEPWVFGNLVLGGLIGAAVDFGTGHWAAYDPSEWIPEETEAEAAPAPAKAESKKEKPAKAKRPKPEPEKVEQATPEPAKAEPAKAEPAAPKPVEAEPDKAEPAAPAPVEAEPEAVPDAAPSDADELDALLENIGK